MEQDEIETKLEEMEAEDSVPPDTSNAAPEVPPTEGGGAETQKPEEISTETNESNAPEPLEAQVEHKVQVLIHDPNGGTNQSSENLVYIQDFGNDFSTAIVISH